MAEGVEEDRRTYKFSAEEAFWRARRVITNNALRRKQKSLSLRQYGLTAVPKELGLLVDLETLDLSENQLTEIPDFLAQLTSLRQLDISNNELRTLPACLKSLNELLTLNASSNKINYIDPSLSQLEQLRYFNADDNNIEDFPVFLKEIANLEELLIGNNSIDVIPEEIVQFSALRRLAINMNDLGHIPEELGMLTSIEHLDISLNRISRLPKSIGKMKYLTDFDASLNEIRTLPQEITNLKSIRNLNLSYNEISSIPDGFDNILPLQVLDLTSNKIFSLPLSLVTSDISEIYLQSNKISEIPIQLANSDIEIIDFRDNPIGKPFDLLSRYSLSKSTEYIKSWLRGELDLDTLPPLPSPIMAEDLPQVPKQKHGPHFDIDDDGLVSFASPASLDLEGNNLARIKQLIPIQKELIKEAIDVLSEGNRPHNSLRERACGYLKIIDNNIEEIDFALLYVEGLRLGNALRAVEQSTDLPELRAGLREAIESVLQIHGPLMLSTSVGIELYVAEQSFNRSPAEERVFRKSASAFAEALGSADGVVRPEVAEFVAGTIQEVGRGANVERSGVVASGTLLNLIITTSTAASLAGISIAATAAKSPSVTVAALTAVLVLAEGLKKSKPFLMTSGLITKGLNKGAEVALPEVIVRLGRSWRRQIDFVLGAEEVLRNLARQRDDFAWMEDLLDWLARQVRD